MSILLRKECQPYLDAANLGMLHVAVEEKCLTLKGECGKTFVSVSGIQFATNTPRNAELEYAVKLFSEFLWKYTEELQNLVNATLAFNELPIVTVPDGLYIPKYWSQDYLQTAKAGVYVGIYENGNMTVSGNGMPIAEAVNLYKTNIEAVSNYFIDVAKYDEQSKQLQTLRSTVAKCNI